MTYFLGYLPKQPPDHELVMSSVGCCCCNFHTARAQESTVTVLEDWRDYKATRSVTFDCMSTEQGYKRVTLTQR